MRRLLTLLIIAISLVTASAQVPMNETLKYRVMYKWGLINKRAGTAILTTEPIDGGMFRAQLTAASAPWADHIYKVRDTLNGTISRQTLEPIFYEKIAHEGKDVKHDIINFRRSGTSVVAECVRHSAKKNGKNAKTSNITLEAEGMTIDMLSSFYYMRQLDFERMTPGTSIELNIFSGKRKELLTITYKGIENIKVDKQKFDTYHITFTFTSDGGKKSSDDISAWLSTAPGHIPIKLEGSLSIGKVQCYLLND